MSRLRRQRRKINTQARRDDLQQAFRIEQALQPMLSHLAQRDIFRQMSAHQFRRGGREQDLFAVGDRHDPRRAIQRRTEIIPIPKFRRTGVQAHPHSQRNRQLGSGRRCLGTRGSDL